MPALGNPKHERFCQELHKLVWAGGSTKESRIAAYQAAGFEACDSLNDNARRFANLKHIKARLGELSDYAAKLAGIDAGWAMLRLKELAESNLDDYLGPPDGSGTRYFTVGKASREKLGLLAELQQDEETQIGENGDGRRILKTKLKLCDRVGTIGLMAKIAGWAAPTRVETTGRDGGPIATEDTTPRSDIDIARRMAFLLAEAAQRVGDKETT
jgi:hypothetical protein